VPILTILAIDSSDAGPLAPVVIGAGWLITAAAGVALAWRGRTDWEPAEEDVSRGPAKVGGVICAVALGLIWILLGSSSGHRTALVWIAATTAAVCFLSLAFYGYLIAVHVYDKVVAVGPEQSKTMKIIGGFRLTRQAAKKLNELDNVTVQNLLRGANYDPDLLWSRQSRAIAKLAFSTSYIALTICGTLALAATAMLFVK
jgi:hypothetical protein